MRELKTAKQVFETLGGITAVRDLMGYSYNRVYNWHLAGEFPAHTFLKMQLALAERECTGAPKLWGMDE